VRLLALDPLQEAVHRALMRLYARQGRRGAALRQYQVCVAALRRELGTEPEGETKALYRDLLRTPADGKMTSGPPAAARPAVPEPRHLRPIFPVGRRRCSDGRRSGAACGVCWTMSGEVAAASPPWWVRPGSARRGSSARWWPTRSRSNAGCS
jgi:hypothetical protein